MKIWIDALTPKQILFFQGIGEELVKNGYRIFFTIRSFRETISLAEKHIFSKFSYYIVGEYGGESLIGKLRASLKRCIQLIDIVEGEEPQIAISYTSPDAARVAFGLNIPHVSISDIPESVAVSRLAIPLSVKLYSPWIIPKNKWTIYGISNEKVYQYKALDPIVWINRHKDDKDTIEGLGLRDEEYIVIRPIEEKASYHLDTIKKSRPQVDQLIEGIRKIDKEVKIFILPRYIDQIERLRKELSEYRGVEIIDTPVDGLTLLKYCKIFIGYGGTMTIESALIGKPTISMRPGKPLLYLKYLKNIGLIYHTHSLNNVIKYINRVQVIRDNLIEKAKKIRENMEDPAKYIAKTINVGLT